jgi:hypothetical protein
MQKWLAALKVDGLDRPDPADLVKKDAQLRNRERPGALWSTVQKAVIAPVGTPVG